MTSQEIANPELAGCEVHGMTRAAFVLRGALAAGAVYGTASVGPFVSQALAASSEGGGDVEILNFALTLEYLEADFYNVKGKQVALSGEAKKYATEFGAEEAEHVSALTAAIKQLGGKPVAKPAFVFPGSSEKSFLALASVLENTGVGAYNGAGPSLKSKQVLASAGSIVQIEARHAAAIDLLIGRSPTPNGGFDVPLSKAQVLAKAGPLIKKT
ncbi:MAG TPA: ferritin-like domain-containing protein [Solirubrobacteraceae bacterium]|jgi:rubrerythrin|nr:ferritin-like domain-containing protein [Solirubrobacteraceae bacterium]